MVDHFHVSPDDGEGTTWSLKLFVLVKCFKVCIFAGHSVALFSSLQSGEFSPGVGCSVVVEKGVSICVTS
jgi:hypothetical protein